ncbi:MAG TPA: S-methyl-5-thioribose-1-phosphate isomerase [Bacteroidota bacterium]|nr:S-methyl-5-thioribose-1-phosphate isomerase [Bacteroidota bacterium]
MMVSPDVIKPIEWFHGRVRYLDQTLLPAKVEYRETEDESVLASEIKRLAIRAAPLIGIAAAYGVALAINKVEKDDPAQRKFAFERAYTLFAATRPTAVNLFWALERMRRVFRANEQEPLDKLKHNLLAEARSIHEEDRKMCEQIGLHGAELLPTAAAVLTHCNTGRLATGGIGTALGIIATAWEQKKLKHVYIDETRPLLQGSRLTTWELSMYGIPATLVVDSAAGFLMQRGLVNAVIVGADRIAANGDVANKIGTYGLAVLAKHHQIPFYVAAPTSTIDFDVASGALIPIEQRASSELFQFFDQSFPGGDIEVYNPAFDITPNALVTAIITEKGVIERPTAESMSSLRSHSELSKRAGQAEVST